MIDNANLIIIITAPGHPPRGDRARRRRYTDYTLLYYTVLYCTVLYCTVLYCTVLIIMIVAQTAGASAETQRGGDSDSR